MTANNNGRLLTDSELNEFLTEAGMTSDRYQEHQRQKHDQAIESGNAAKARDVIWRAASDKNLINEAREPELTEDRAAALKSKLGWK
ncbi:hypothetical protein H6G51_18205 [Limnothrix sp. FACHB-708]|uniref:hypothetical protein n=1 Tax=unclassified Limnothrix TaxID=2632864 RepID=UPI001687F20E|nr:MULTISPECIES: hypothetical protein [unclassified Limnothrix]MBD2555222.1 hypothetical protein [Limnothrix sp. FACHB-708]MBD2592647.1 hypothetical protein [Limnothrix sp. FACHB-406]